MCSSDYRLTGILGLVILTLLLLYTLEKFFQYLRYAWMFGHLWKKFAFHAFILLGILSDMPLYIMFVIDCDYNAVAYAFHIMKLCFLFVSFSLMISDWTSVVTKGLQKVNYILKDGPLIVINILFALVSVTQAVAVSLTSSVSDFADSYIYIAGYWFQIVTAFLLCVLMFWSGHRLAQRLSRAISSSFSAPFQEAITRLNRLMGLITVALMIQVVMLIVNFGTHTSSDTDKTFIPWFFWWACAVWLPLVVWVTCLMKVCRTDIKSFAMGDGNDPAVPFLDPSENSDERDLESGSFNNSHGNKLSLNPTPPGTGAKQGHPKTPATKHALDDDLSHLYSAVDPDEKRRRQQQEQQQQQQQQQQGERRETGLSMRRAEEEEPEDFPLPSYLGPMSQQSSLSSPHDHLHPAFVTGPMYGGEDGGEEDGGDRRLFRSPQSQDSFDGLGSFSRDHPDYLDLDVSHGQREFLQSGDSDDPFRRDLVDSFSSYSKG